MKKRKLKKEPSWPDEQKGLMIRQARKHLHLSQRDLGEMVYAGFVAVSQWETGRRIPQRATWALFLKLMAERGIKFDTKGNLVFDTIDSPTLDNGAPKKKKAA